MWTLPHFYAASGHQWSGLLGLPALEAPTLDGHRFRCLYGSNRSVLSVNDDSIAHESREPAASRVAGIPAGRVVPYPKTSLLWRLYLGNSPALTRFLLCKLRYSSHASNANSVSTTLRNVKESGAKLYFNVDSER